MSDGSLLLLVLWLLYLPECVQWLPRHSVAFMSPLGLRWLAVTAGETFGSASGSLRLLNPLPPLGRHHRVDLLPVSISPERIAAFNTQALSRAGRPRQSGATIAIDAIESVSVRDTAILINGRPFAKVANAELRASLRNLLDDLRSRPVAGRAARIEAFWRPQFHAQRAHAAVAAAGRRSSTLSAACNAQFLLVFVTLPVLSVMKGLSYVIIPGAVAMETLAVLIALIYFRSHRRLYRAASGDRVVNLAKMILCAPLSIRASDALAAPALGRFHILTVASALENFPGRDDFVGTVMRDLRHPVEMALLDERVAATCRWHNDTVSRIATESLGHVRECAAKADAPPERIDPGTRCFCPRCLSQYSIDAETCPDCHGVRLITVAPAESQPAESTSHG